MTLKYVSLQLTCVSLYMQNSGRSDEIIILRKGGSSSLTMNQDSSLGALLIIKKFLNITDIFLKLL